MAENNVSLGVGIHLKDASEFEKQLGKKLDKIGGNMTESLTVDKTALEALQQIGEQFAKLEKRLVAIMNQQGALVEKQIQLREQAEKTRQADEERKKSLKNLKGIQDEIFNIEKKKLQNGGELSNLDQKRLDALKQQRKTHEDNFKKQDKQLALIAKKEASIEKMKNHKTWKAETIAKNVAKAEQELEVLKQGLDKSQLRTNAEKEQLDLLREKNRYELDSVRNASKKKDISEEAAQVAKMNKSILEDSKTMTALKKEALAGVKVETEEAKTLLQLQKALTEEQKTALQAAKVATEEQKRVQIGINQAKKEQKEIQNELASRQQKYMVAEKQIIELNRQATAAMGEEHKKINNLIAIRRQDQEDLAIGLPTAQMEALRNIYQLESDIKASRQTEKEAMKEITKASQEFYKIRNDITRLEAKQLENSEAMTAKERERLASSRAKLPLLEEQMESTVAQAESNGIINDKYQERIRKMGEIASTNDAITLASTRAEQAQNRVNNLMVEYNKNLEQAHKLKVERVGKSQEEVDLIDMQIVTLGNRNNKITQSLNASKSFTSELQNQLSILDAQAEAKLDMALAQKKIKQAVTDTAKTQDMSITNLNSSFMVLDRLYRQMLTPVKALDQAFINMTRVLDTNDAAMNNAVNNFESNMFRQADAMGVMIEAYMKATEKWLIAGFTDISATGDLIAEELGRITSMAYMISPDVSSAAVMQKYLHVVKNSFMETGDVIDEFLQDFINGANQMANEFPVTMDAVGNAMQRMAVSAQNAGLTWQEATAIAGTAINQTQLSGERVGTAMNSLFTRTAQIAGEFTGAMREQHAELQRLGVNVVNAEGDMHSFYDILRQVQSAFDDTTDPLNKLERQTILNVLAGQSYANILGAIVDGLDEYHEMLDVIDSQAGLFEDGSAWREHERLMESINVQWNRLQNLVKELWFEFSNGGQLVSDVLETTISVFERLRVVVSNPAFQQFISQFVIPLTTLAVATKIAGMVTQFTGLKKIITPLFTIFKTGIPDLVGGIGKATTATGKLKAGFAGLKAIMGPKGWTILALGGAFAELNRENSILARALETSGAAVARLRNETDDMIQSNRELRNSMIDIEEATADVQTIIAEGLVTPGALNQDGLLQLEDDINRIAQNAGIDINVELRDVEHAHRIMNELLITMEDMNQIRSEQLIQNINEGVSSIDDMTRAADDARRGIASIFAEHANFSDASNMGRSMEADVRGNAANQIVFEFSQDPASLNETLEAIDNTITEFAAEINDRLNIEFLGPEKHTEERLGYMKEQLGEYAYLLEELLALRGLYNDLTEYGAELVELLLEHEDTRSLAIEEATSLIREQLHLFEDLDATIQGDVLNSLIDSHNEIVGIRNATQELNDDLVEQGHIRNDQMIELLKANDDMIDVIWGQIELGDEMLWQDKDREEMRKYLLDLLEDETFNLEDQTYLHKFLLDLLEESLDLLDEELKMRDISLEQVEELLGLMDEVTGIDEHKLGLMFEQNGEQMFAIELYGQILLLNGKLLDYDEKHVSMLLTQAEKYGKHIELIGGANGETIKLIETTSGVVYAIDAANGSMTRFIDNTNGALSAMESLSQAAAAVGDGNAVAGLLRGHGLGGTGWTGRDFTGGGGGGATRDPRPAREPRAARGTGGAREREERESRAEREERERREREERERNQRVSEDIWRHWAMELDISRTQHELNQLARIMAQHSGQYAQMIPLLQQQERLLRQEIAQQQALRGSRQTEMGDVLAQLRGHGFQTDGNNVTNLGITQSMYGEQAQEVERLLNQWRNIYGQLKGIDDTIANTEMRIRQIQENLDLQRRGKEMERLNVYLERANGLLQSIGNQDSIFETMFRGLGAADVELSMAVHNDALIHAQQSASDLMAEFNRLSTATIEHGENAEEVQAKLEQLSQEILSQADAIVAYQMAINQMRIDRIVNDLESFNNALTTNRDRITQTIDAVRNGLQSGTDINDLLSSATRDLDFRRDNEFTRFFQDRINMEQQLQNALDAFGERNIERSRNVANAELQIIANQFNQILQMHNDLANNIPPEFRAVDDQFGLGGSAQIDPGFQMSEELGEMFRHLQERQNEVREWFADAMADATTQGERDDITAEFIRQNLLLQQQWFEQEIEANNRAIAEFERELGSENLTGEQRNQILGQIRDLEDRNIDAQNNIRDSIRERMNFEFELLQRNIDRYEEYFTLLNHSLAILDAINSQDLGLQLRILEDMFTLEMSRNNEIRRSIRDLESQQALLEEGSLEWNIINEQLEYFNQQLRDSDLSILGQNAAILDARFSKIFDRLERNIFNGMNLAEWQQWREDWVEGIERERELEEMYNRIAELNADNLRDEFAILERQERLSREQLRYLNAQLDLVALQRRLENLRDQRTMRTLVDRGDGTFDVEWTYDHDLAEEIEREISEQERELERMREEAQTSFVDRLQQILQQGQNGQFETVDDMRSAIEDLKDLFGGILGEDFFDLISGDIDDILEAFEEFLNNQEDVVASSDALTPANIGAATAEAMEDSAESIGRTIANELRDVLESLTRDAFGLPEIESFSRITAASESGSGGTVNHYNVNADFSGLEDATEIKRALESLPRLAKQNKYKK